MTAPKNRGAKRAKILTVILALLVMLLVTLVGAAEFIARSAVPPIAEKAVREALDLEPGHPVEFTPQGFVLAQLVTGRLNNAEVTVPDAPIIDGLDATLTVHAGSIALDPLAAPLENTTVRLGLSPEQFNTFVTSVSDGMLDSAKTDGTKFTVAREFEAFGASVPVTGSVTIEVVDGGLRFTPTEFSAAGIKASPADVQKLLGSILGPDAIELSQPIDLCVRDRLPRGTRIMSISPQPGGEVSITLDIADKITTDAKLREFGTCE